VWYVITPNPASNATADPHFQFQRIDGKYTPTKTPISGTFTRPFAESLNEGLRLNSNPLNSASLAATQSASIVTRQFGSAYVIDPMYVAAAAQTRTSNFNRICYAFPASALMNPAQNGGQYYKHTGWDPWKAANRNQLTWPIRRATLQQSTGWPMDPRMAEHFFRGTDELATELPDRDDRPANQRWETLDRDNDGIGDAPLARQWTGDYSWIICVSPTTNAARDGMAHNPESFAYDVSVVVFYKRPLPTAAPQSTADLVATASFERSVGAKIVSTGLTGGELLLTDLRDGSESAFNHLKSGQWIMLCGPHPNSSMTEPRFVLNWYQVLSIDGKNEKLDESGMPTNNQGEPERRLVTVRGPQWPWVPAQRLDDYSHLSNDVCVAICRGAVAVHTKTLRLDSSRSGGGGMAVVVPNGVPGPGIVAK
jgi:hypothetical protein